MAPEQIASLAVLARLRRETAVDRAALAARAEELRVALPLLDQVPWRAVAAVALHAWYTALESMFERVARAIDLVVPTGAASHHDLLSAGMTEIAGMRPAIVPDRLAPELEALLSFRHFFRHAYAVELDPKRLLEHGERVERIRADVDAALLAFDEFLAETARAAGGGA